MAVAKPCVSHLPAPPSLALKELTQAQPGLFLSCCLLLMVEKVEEGRMNGRVPLGRALTPLFAILFLPVLSVLEKGAQPSSLPA